jgi:dihydropteroate synthase
MLDLPALVPGLASEVECSLEPYNIGMACWDFSRRRHIVGVINLSTDSQYPESIACSEGQALEKAEAMMAAGASIIEFGSQSTRPGAMSRTVEQNLDILQPILVACSRLGIPIAVETASAEVAACAAEAGAVMLNVVGYQELDRISCVAAERDLTLVLPYLSGVDAYHPQPVDPANAFGLISLSLGDLVSRARKAGITKCIIDPGVGFYFPVSGGEQSRVSYQLSMYLKLHQLRVHRVPILVTLIQASSVFQAGYRRLAEPVIAALALLGGANIIRTHEVGAVERVRYLLDHADPI